MVSWSPFAKLTEANVFSAIIVPTAASVKSPAFWTPVNEPVAVNVLETVQLSVPAVCAYVP